MSVDVTSSRRRSAPMAECEQCEIPDDLTRRQVRQHVTATGHTAWVMIEDSTVYTKAAA